MKTHGIDPVWFVKTQGACADLTDKQLTEVMWNSLDLDGVESPYFEAWGEKYNRGLIRGVLRLRKERRLKRLRKNKRRQLLNRLLICTGLFVDTENSH